MPKCDHCPAEIIFVRVRSRTGTIGVRPIPLNAVPDPTGNIAVGPVRGIGRLGRYVMKGEPLLDSEERYLPHFASCPSYHKPKAEPATPRRPKPAPQPDLFTTATEE